MVDATPRQILLYLPNLIGYTRILLSITSLTLMIFSPTSYILSSVLYLSSFIGDLFDGMVARKYNQTSTFGGLMDMVTDRCSTTGLLCVLIREFADKSGFVLVSIVFVCTHSVWNTSELHLLECIPYSISSQSTSIGIDTRTLKKTAIHTPNHPRHLFPLVSNVLHHLPTNTSQIRRRKCQ